MAAVKSHGYRPVIEKLFETNHLAVIVRQDEWGHRFAYLGCRLAGTILTKPLYKPIHRSGKFRALSSYRVSKGTKLVLQRCVQIARAIEGVVQGLPLKIRSHGNIPPGASTDSNLSRSTPSHSAFGEALTPAAHTTPTISPPVRPPPTTTKLRSRRLEVIS